MPEINGHVAVFCLLLQRFDLVDLRVVQNPKKTVEEEGGVRRKRSKGQKGEEAKG